MWHSLPMKFREKRVRQSDVPKHLPIGRRTVARYVARGLVSADRKGRVRLSEVVAVATAPVAGTKRGSRLDRRPGRAKFYRNSAGTYTTPTREGAANPGTVAGIPFHEFQRRYRVGEKREIVAQKSREFLALRGARLLAETDPSAREAFLADMARAEKQALRWERIWTRAAAQTTPRPRPA